MNKKNNKKRVGFGVKENSRFVNKEIELGNKEIELNMEEEPFIMREIRLIRRELKPLLNFGYPKLAGLIIIIIAAYFIFSNPQVSNYVSSLNNWGYLGVIIAGIFFTLGFTSPLSAGFFITLNPENIWFAAILGGFGAMIGDLLIFKFIKFSFMDEFHRLEQTVIIKKVSYLIEWTIGHKIKVYLMYAFAGFLIVSPLPDEAAIIMLAGLTKIKIKILAILSFLMNALGILILLSI